jgi:hypothetical protein
MQAIWEEYYFQVKQDAYGLSIADKQTGATCTEDIKPLEIQCSSDAIAWTLIFGSVAL